MFNEMFDLERRLMEMLAIDEKEFIGSRLYQCLEICLIERWNAVNDLHTYPNMQ